MELYVYPDTVLPVYIFKVPVYVAIGCYIEIKKERKTTRHRHRQGRGYIREDTGSG